MISEAYNLADKLMDEGSKEHSLLLGAVAGLAEARGRIIDELANIARETSKAKRIVRLQTLAFAHPDEDCLSWARLLCAR